ncbi:MAG: DUF2723 domain-containing protein [Anaerolineae bacterium]|nr:MAG: DUF2723 domain-containing protein [Anaerolineae bacterium]
MAFQPQHRRTWIVVAMAAAALLFLSTVQTIPNGSTSPYTTDVGEIQNALPRWGTIHWTGYPLYTFLGSLFVTLLHWAGIPPAVGTSLFSALWGVVSVGLLAMLLQELGALGPITALGALVAATSASLWMDASLAEVHTLTVAFSMATLLFSVRLGRSGKRRDLLFLALIFSQGIAHQRAVVFLAPAVVVLIHNQARAIWRDFFPALGLSLLAPLTYLYLPLRVSQGATWTFGNPGTWQRTLSMLLDNRAERVISQPERISEWGERIARAFTLTSADFLPWLLVMGLIGLLVPLLEKRWREALGLTFAWVPYLLLTSMIWIGRVGDAQLAAQLPMAALATVGLALLADRIGLEGREGRAITLLTLAGVVVAQAALHRPAVLEVTRDPRAETVIATAEQISPLPPELPTTLMALWGNDFWALAYAQSYQGRLPGLNIVDHNANFEDILARGDRLLTLNATFYQRPVSWWERRLGRVYLSSAAPEIVEIALEPSIAEDDLPPGPELDLQNGIWIRSAQVSLEKKHLVLTVYWQADAPLDKDYSVAVHLVARDPPQGPEDILDQADLRHPVYGWYPTSRWHTGEIVRGHYQLEMPEDAQPQAIRVALYRRDETGNFLNSPWLYLPIGK